MPENKQKFEFISLTKTFCLLLVVFSHCMLFYVDNPFFPNRAEFSSPAATRIYGVIDASVISSFVMCSGFLFMLGVTKKKKTGLQLLSNRAKRLLLPYFLYGAFWLVPLYTIFDIACFGRPDHAGFLEGYQTMLLGQFSDHLWFLWMLFWVNCFFILFMRVLEQGHVWLVFLAAYGGALIVTLRLADFPYFKLSQIAPHLLCFGLGCILYFYEEKLSQIPLPLYALLGVLFLVLIVLYDENPPEEFVYGYGVKLCGALFFYCIFRTLAGLPVVAKMTASRFWKFTERRSMNIYLLNCPFMFLYFRLLYPVIGQNAFLCILANTVLSFTSIYLTVFVQDKLLSLLTPKKAEG